MFFLSIKIIWEHTMHRQALSNLFCSLPLAAWGWPPQLFLFNPVVRVQAHCWMRCNFRYFYSCIFHNVLSIFVWPGSTAQRNRSTVGSVLQAQEGQTLVSTNAVAPSIEGLLYRAWSAKCILFSPPTVHVAAIIERFPQRY